MPVPEVGIVKFVIGAPIFSTNPFASVEFVYGETLDAETFVPTDIVLPRLVVVLIPTINFLGYDFNELSCNLELTKSLVDKSELNNVREPGVVTNEHLYKLNFKS